MHTEFPLINAVLQKKQEGYVYNIGVPSFIIHKSGFSYLKLSDENDLNSIIDFFANEQSLPMYFHIYNPPNNLIERIKNDNRFGNKLRKRIQLRYKEDKLKTSYKDFLGKKFQIFDISRNNFESLRLFNLKLNSQFWKSESDFLKNGFGKVVIYDNLPVSVCYTSCIVDNIAEIDIATLPARQGKGFAKIVTEAFIEISIDKGIEPNWDCFEENIPSLKTASVLGRRTPRRAFGTPRLFAG